MISVLIPTLNEEKNILPLLSSVSEKLELIDHEIIVVDDGSVDATALLVSSITDDRVCLIKRFTDHSLARSIGEGIASSKGETVIVMDSDFNHSPSYLVQFLSLTEHYDLVTASRFKNVNFSELSIRLKLTYLLNLAIKQLTGIKQTDCTFGFFAVKRDILLQCPADKIFWGFGDYYFRLLYYLQKVPLRTVEFQAVHEPRRAGCGNRRIFQTAVSYIREAMKLAFQRLRYA